MARRIGTESRWTRRRCPSSSSTWPFAKRRWRRPMWFSCGTMVRRAAGYLVRNGPVSPQDRWEEDPGYSPFTVAAQIAALLAAADLADLSHEAAVGRLPSRDCRRLALIHRPLDVRLGDGLVPAVRRQRILRPDRPERDGRRRRALRERCTDQERRGLRGHPGRQPSGEPRCAGAGALRPPRCGRSAHARYDQGHRRAAQDRDADGTRPGIDTTAMAMASTRTGRRSTERGLVVAGPC